MRPRDPHPGRPGLKFWPFLWREIHAHYRFALLFVLILGLGLAGFLLVEGLRASVATSLEKQSRALLSADLSLSLRRPFTAAEEEKIVAALGHRPYSRSVEFFSMLSKGGKSFLVLVKAVDPNYPLFGTLATDPVTEEKIGAALATEPTLTVSPEILEQLGASVGEELGLAGQKFRVASAIRDDPTQSFRAFALGGRAYVGRDALEALEAGSTATYSYLVLAPGEEDALKQKIEALFPGAELRVSTAREAGESAARALAYMGDFLGLVSLVALLLSSLGAAYLYRSYLERRKNEIAIYRALGVSLPMIQFQAAVQTILLALLAILPATALAALLLPLLERMIGLWSQVDLQLALPARAFLPLLFLCVLGTPLVLLPELLVLRHFTPLALFREQEREARRRSFWAQLPALTLFLLLAFLVSRSFRTAGIFLGLLALLLVGLFLLLRAFTYFLPKIRAGGWAVQHALFFLARKKRAAATVFLTLSLGSLLLHLLPQLETSLRAELEAPTRLPSLFLFDIQDEQRAALESELQKRGHALTSVAPLVRARILAVNDKAFERVTESGAFATREDEQDARFRNRGVNLSYREGLQESESIIRGEAFSGLWNEASGELPKISVETRFAERLGLKIGDVLRFDLQGVEILGRIVNERRVRWTSFQPNFFLLFQDGVLNAAPKTFIANLPALPSEEKQLLQTLLAKDFPNVSVIDVSSTITRALDILAQMRLALVLLAGLALAAGLSVLGSVLTLEARDRAQALLLYRVLGASEKDLRKILFLESSLISGLAVAFGALGSLAFTYGLSYFLFDGAFAINIFSLVALSALLLGISLAVTWIASRGLVKRPPLELVRGS